MDGYPGLGRDSRHLAFDRELRWSPNGIDIVLFADANHLLHYRWDDSNHRLSGIQWDVRAIRDDERPGYMYVVGICSKRGGAIDHYDYRASSRVSDVLADVALYWRSHDGDALFDDPEPDDLILPGHDQYLYTVNGRFFGLVYDHRLYSRLRECGGICPKPDR